MTKREDIDQLGSYLSTLARRVETLEQRVVDLMAVAARKTFNPLDVIGPGTPPIISMPGDTDLQKAWQERTSDMLRQDGSVKNPPDLSHFEKKAEAPNINIGHESKLLPRKSRFDKGPAPFPHPSRGVPE